jgi:glycosyltransferase involved in cell wall biosynthesis
MQAVTPGTHMDYVYEMARTLREERGLPLTLVIEKAAPVEVPDWVVVQSFNSSPLRVMENFYLLLKLRFSGHKVFYIHYSFISAIAAGLITKVLGGTVYYWNAGMPWQYKRSWWVDLYQKAAYQLLDYLVTGAEALVEGYSNYYHVPKESIRVISNWIDLSKVSFSQAVRDQVRQELNVPQNAPTLLFVQKLSKRKGAHFLPEIFDRLNEPHTHLIVAGDGPEENALHAWAKSHSYTANIHFTGRVSRDKMKELYQTADIFLLLSEEEGSSHSLIEVQAYSLPFVGFAVGGVPETVSPHQRGDLCQYGDLDCLLSKLASLLAEDSVKERKMEMRKWILGFDKKVITEKYVTLFTSINSRNKVDN